MLKKEFDFVLNDKLVYSHGGQAGLFAKKLLLRAPSVRLLILASKLSSIVMTALVKARENYKTDDLKSSIETPSITLDGMSVYILISAHVSSEQMEVFVSTFKDLIVSKDICLIDGKEPLTLDVLDYLDSREMLRLLGEYTANFLLPSIIAP